MSMENKTACVKVNKKGKALSNILGSAREVVKKKVAELVRKETVRNISEMASQVTLVSASNSLMAKIKKMEEDRVKRLSVR